MVVDEQIGPWRIADRLGSGGNGDVYRAFDANGRDVALKLIHAKRSTAEPYRRFVREIEFLRTRQNLDGVLPLIDSYLPESPARGDRPWLAMPVATPLRDALESATAPEVVAAVATVAGTLARLHAEGIAHRDIKPGNLYSHESQWLVGDFGLVALPDINELTVSGRPLGPAHYMPREMLVDPASADPFKADVFSLAKTLWVLATGQRWPIEGHQRVGALGCAIADYRYYPRAQDLDRLVDRATLLLPGSRPSMDEFARELHAWQKLAVSEPVIDVSAASEILRAKLAGALAGQDEAGRRKEYALSAVKDLQEAFRPLNAALLALHPQAQVDGPPDKFTTNVLRTIATFGSPEVIFRHQRLSQITSGDSHSLPLALRLGRCLELSSDGDISLHIFVDVCHPAVMGPRFYDWHPKPWTAAAGSIEWSAVMDAALSETAEHLQKAALAFAEASPES